MVVGRGDGEHRNFDPGRRRLLFVGSAGVLGTVLFPTVVRGQDELTFGIDLPETVRAGESTLITAEAAIPEDPLFDHESELTVRLSIDGTQVAERTVTVEDGETTEIEFMHMFRSPGESDVTIAGEITIFETDFDAEETVTASVLEPELTTLEGVTVQLDPETERDVLDSTETVAETLGVDFGSETVVLHRDGERWIAIDDAPIETGRATIEGITADADEWDAIEEHVVFVESADIETTGEEIALEELRDDPTAYDETLVRITDDYRQVAYVLDVAEGELAQQSSTGAFDAADDLDVLPPGQAGQWAAMYLSSPDVGEERTDELEDRLGASQPTVQDTGSRRFWMDAEATIDGVVLASEAVEPETATASTLHVADRSIHGTTVKDLESVVAGEYDGEIISVQSSAAELRLSIKKSLLEVAQCAPDSVLVGNTCLPILGDAVVHGGVLYDGEPTDRDDSLLYVGLSNELQEMSHEYRHTILEVTGEVVTAGDVDPAFGEQRALVVYDVDVVEAIDDPVPEAVADYREELYDQLLEQAETPLGEYETDPDSDPPDVAEYADEDGIVQPPGVLEAIDDWRADEIDTPLVLDVIEAWRDGEPVT